MGGKLVDQRFTELPADRNADIATFRRYNFATTVHSQNLQSDDFGIDFWHSSERRNRGMVGICIRMILNSVERFTIRVEMLRIFLY